MGSGSAEEEVLAKIALAVERERTRIARGLHDQVGGKLTDAASALERLDPSPETERLKRLIGEALESTRSMTFELGLPAVGEHGLGGMLETVCKTADARYEMNVFFEEHGDAVEPDGGVVLVLSQIVRELLFNVVKHAQASTAAVSLTYEPGKLRIEVTDDGVGLTGELNSDGFGLADSRNRMSDLGGHFEFGSKDGHGTRVVLELPLG